MTNIEKDKIITILLSGWLVLSFIINFIWVVMTTGSIIESVFSIASMGMIAWVGLILRKDWGIILLGLYLFVVITESPLYDSLTNYIIFLVYILGAVLLIKYLIKNKGLIW